MHFENKTLIPPAPLEVNFIIAHPIMTNHNTKFRLRHFLFPPPEKKGRGQRREERRKCVMRKRKEGREERRERGGGKKSGERKVGESFDFLSFSCRGGGRREPPQPTCLLFMAHARSSTPRDDAPTTREAGLHCFTIREMMFIQ